MKETELKKYPQYKPSGIEWIGEIPEEWELNKLKYLTDNYDSKRVPLSSDQRGIKQGEYPYYGATGVIDNINEYLFDGDYVLVGEDGAPFFITNRDVAFKVTGKFWVNNHAHILKCKDEINEEILVYQLNLVDYRRYITGSTRDKLTQSDLASIILIDIPKSEQTAIANYLDDKTAKIDTLIEKKKKLIELLKEERTAVINQAVTRGINTNVKLKDSGIEWLGEIPEHWEVKKLKYILKPTKGALKPGPFGSDLKNSDVSPSGTYKVYTQRNVIENDFEQGEDFVSDEKFTELNAFEIFPGDILLTTRGTIGRSALFTKGLQRGVLHPCLIRLQINDSKSLNNWLLIYFNESSYFIDNVKLNSNSTVIDVIYGYTLRDVIIPIPPVAEQYQIIQYIETETKQIDGTISKIEKEIELLAEYRTALISEVVTGKIKVT